jgi:hypothetical protein
MDCNCGFYFMLCDFGRVRFLIFQVDACFIFIREINESGLDYDFDIFLVAFFNTFF